MTRERQLAAARVGAIASLAIVVLAVGVLAADYAIARVRLPHDDARLAELQARVRDDAGVAPTLAVERDAVTGARRARRARTDALAIVLVAAAAAFVGSVKWRTALGPRRPVPSPAPSRKAIRLRTLADTLVAYRIDDACTGCTLCAQACPTGAIAYRPYATHVVDDARCTWCDKCMKVCQDGAIDVVYTATGQPAPRPRRSRPFAS
jgi:ferredoxin